MIEIFKDIVGYEGLYQVSNTGRVKTLQKPIKHKGGGYAIRKEKTLTPVKRKNGYLRVLLSKDGNRESVRVHKLVLIAFSENPLNKPQINHINGVKQDNRVENLEWCTCSENHMHAFKIGLKNQRGENNNASKLTESDVSVIKSLLKDKKSNASISRMFNVSDVTICNIKKGKIWSHVILKTA